MSQNPRAYLLQRHRANETNECGWRRVAAIATNPKPHHVGERESSHRRSTTARASSREHPTLAATRSWSRRVRCWKAASRSPSRTGAVGAGALCSSAPPAWGGMAAPRARKARGLSPAFGGETSASASSRAAPRRAARVAPSAPNGTIETTASSPNADAKSAEDSGGGLRAAAAASNLQVALTGAPV